MNSPNTIAALKEWERTAPERNKLWDEAYSNEAVLDAMAADEKARLMVLRAFHEDTKHLNSWSQVKVCSVHDIMKMVKYNAGSQ